MVCSGKISPGTADLTAIDPADLTRTPLPAVLAVGRTIGFPYELTLTRLPSKSPPPPTAP